MITQFDLAAFAKLKLKLPPTIGEAGDVLARFILGGVHYAVQESSVFETGHIVNLLPNPKVYFKFPHDNGALSHHWCVSLASDQELRLGTPLCAILVHSARSCHACY